jgi:very-short-patch-repair endonuclease
VEQILARLAGRAHGVVTRAQLLAAGVSRDEIKHRVRSGALLRVYRGVYRVGHRAPSVEAQYMAAVLACGEGAVLSGRAAAHHFGLLRGPPVPPEVIAPSERRVRGIRTRRSRAVETTTWRGIPVTTVPRTLVDLAAVLPADELARAAHEAEVKHQTGPDLIAAVLAQRPTTPGAAKLRTVLSGDEKVTLSKLEAKFLERLRDAGLPLPETNRPAGTKRVDCRWPEHRLTVELDSYRYHRSRHAWEEDRRREREAHARGDQFRRYTYRDVLEEPELMLRELRALLPRAGSTPRARGRRRAAA